MMQLRPSAREYAPYFQQYVDQVKSDDILVELEAATDEALSLFKAIPEEKRDFAYASGKWTIKEVIMHLMDVERVFAYRALRISRNDQTPLLKFDHDEYVNYYNAAKRNWDALLEEFVAVRSATTQLFQHLDADMWERKGMASNQPVSVLALAYLIVGHQKHHFNILRERYL